MTQNSAAPIAPARGIPPPDKIRRILVCQQRQIGDVLLATPAIELLARHYPLAEISVFTEKKCAPMLENNPNVHKIITVDKDDVAGKLKAFLFYWRTGRAGYDLLVNFQHLPRCTWVSALSNCKLRLGSSATDYARFIYTHTAPLLPGYAAASKASLLRILGISWSGERPRLYLTAAERAAGQELLREMGLLGKRFISVDATHFDAARLWPPQHYAALMDMAAEARPDLRFMLSYGPGEEGQVKELMALCRHRERLAMFPRVLSLRHAAACMERAAMHIGNCSAPSHMAVALDVPSLVFKGSTGRQWTFPSPEHRQVSPHDFPALLATLPKSDGEIPHEHHIIYIRALTPDWVIQPFLEHLDEFGKKREIQ